MYLVIKDNINEVYYIDDGILSRSLYFSVKKYFDNNKILYEEFDHKKDAYECIKKKMKGKMPKFLDCLKNMKEITKNYNIDEKKLEQFFECMEKQVNEEIFKIGQ